MTIEESIKEAIKEGWEGGGGWSKFQIVIGGVGFYDEGDTFAKSPRGNLVALGDIFLDPLFWQALGRAMDWKDFEYSYYVMSHHPRNYKCELQQGKPNCYYCGYWKPVDRFEDIPEHLKAEPNAWRRHLRDDPEYVHNLHRLIDVLNEGRTAEDYFSSL